MIALLFLALGLRVVVLWTLFDNLSEDRDNYRNIAQGIVAGKGSVDPHAGTPTAYRPPLYPLLLAAVLGWGGGELSIGIIQLLMGAATVGMTVVTGRRLGFNRASLLAGLLVAVDPLLLSQAALVMTETLAAFLAVCLIGLCLGPRTMKGNFALGLVFGLCCLCRPTFWAYGVMAVIVQACLEIRACPLDRYRSSACWKPGLCLGAGMVLAMSPWVVRNMLAMGSPILTTTHGGYTLLLAHNPAYTRAVVEQPWGTVWEGDTVTEWKKTLESEMARATPPIDMTHLSPGVEIARDRWMRQRASDYIRSEPLLAVRSGLTLLGRFWNVVPMATQGAPVAPAIRVAIGTYYVTVFLAMLLGIIHVVRTGWSTWWPVLALVAAFTLVHSLYWADMRMRAPLTPAIALLAAAGSALPNRIKFLWPIVKWAMFLAVLGFVARHGYVLWTDPRWATVDHQAVHLHWGWLALATVTATVAWLPSAWFWRRLLSNLGPTPAWPQLLKSYYCGHLGKYLPGKAAAIVIRTALIKEAGVSPVPAAVSVTVESATYMWAGTLLVVILFPSLAHYLPQQIVAAAGDPFRRAGLATLVVCGGLAGLALLMRHSYRLTTMFRGAAGDLPAASSDAPVRTALTGVVVFLAAWWIQGLALGFTIAAVTGRPLAWQDWPFWTATAAVALIGGFVAVFTPGGLGVREGLLMEILSRQLGPHEAVLVAILLRGAALAGEILTAGALYYAVNGKKGGEKVKGVEGAG